MGFPFRKALTCPLWFVSLKDILLEAWNRYDSGINFARGTNEHIKCAYA